jgi:hypothetical protein
MKAVTGVCDPTFKQLIEILKLEQECSCSVLVKLFHRIYLTIRVSTAAAERCFSTLRRLEMY